MKNLKYLQVQKEILDYIPSKKLQPGSLLPTEKCFAELFDVSIFTVRRALDNLAKHNIIDRKHGRGTFVASHLEEFEPKGTVIYLTISRYTNDDENTNIAYQSIENSIGTEGILGHNFKKHGYYFKAMPRGGTPLSNDIDRLRNSSGILVSGYLNNEWLNLLKGLNKPLLVAGNTNYKKLPIASVIYDWRALTSKLGRYWLNKGSKEIALIAAGENYAPSLAMREGFRYLMNTHGNGYDSSKVFFTQSNQIRNEIWEFLAENPELDTLLVDQGLYAAVLEYLWQNKLDMRIAVLMAYSRQIDWPQNVIGGGFSENLWQCIVDSMVKQIAVGTMPIASIKMKPGVILGSD